MTTKHKSEYDDQFLGWLEWLWGEGRMSPGGAEEVAAILGNLDIRGRQVLDIGSGLGTVDVMLVEQHGAAHVTGIDIDPTLIAHANKLRMTAGLTSRIAFQLVEPGPLPFDDNSFDVVFTKDALIHMADKAAIYREIHRILKSGGYFAMSDWFGSDLPETAEYREWLDTIDLGFTMTPIENTTSHLQQIGFVDIDESDRHAWYAEISASELAAVKSEKFQQFVTSQGAEAAQFRMRMVELRNISVNQGLLRPGHIRAKRPH